MGLLLVLLLLALPLCWEQEKRKALQDVVVMGVAGRGCLGSPWP